MAKHIRYTDAELAWIKTNCQRPRAEAHADFVDRFDRQDLELVNFTALCKRNGWLTGRTGQFDKGGVSWNLGKQMPFNPASAATRFKKGSVPANSKPVGHERLTEDGYLMVNIDQINPHTGGPRTYVMKHLHLWQQANGPLPEGMCLKCVDSNRQNCDPANWEMIPRGALPELTRAMKYDDAPDELKPTMMVLARLKHAAANAGKPKKTPGKVGRKFKSEAA